MMALQKQYGKTEAEIQILVEGFCWILADYPMEKIIEAMRNYCTKENDIPAPADIRNIIDPPPVPMSAAVYVSLKKRSFQGELMYGPNLEYIRRFESIERAKSEGTLEEFYQAEKDVRTLRAEYGF
jgi:hypothetical protein